VLIEKRKNPKRSKDMSDNFEKLSKDVKENFSEDGHWQSVLDLGYNEWNRSDGNVHSYDEMIEWMREKYGDFAAMAVLLGKYNQQVCNGGHYQYYDNGYASQGGGCFTNHREDTYLHDKLVEWMKEYKLDSESELSKKVFDIVSSFEVELDNEEYDESSCFECGGSGEVYDEDGSIDGDENEMVSCPECDGSGMVEEYNENYERPMNTSEWESLDNRYYEVSDEWEKHFENFVKSKLS
jgi:hypothetical protein